eukprot:5229131-Pyramimonas_sp.AAC.6
MSFGIVCVLEQSTTLGPLRMAPSSTLAAIVTAFSRSPLVKVSRLRTFPIVNDRSWSYTIAISYT